ncbi:hypothetical protein LTR86_010823 [Recurvomyces mirabilis]|nr:hypothetical protein LTR86_010823 [Recurvomyces mirabilis]
MTSPNPFAARTSLPIQYDTYDFIAPSRFTGKLQGKVVVVTGASAGIGKATAHAFAAAGASAKMVVEIAEKGLGPVDVLLNVAGITRYGTLVAEEDFNTWWRVLEVNLRGPTALIHAVLPSMIKRRTGIVMTVSSTSGSSDVPYNTAYACSKAAVIKLHQDLAVELQRHNILSFSVHPGTVATDLGQLSSAINMKSVQEEAAMQKAFQAFQELKYQTPKLAADTFVALAVEKRLGVLNGRYIDAEQNLEIVLTEAEKENGGRIGKERLYRLKLDEL